MSHRVSVRKKRRESLVLIAFSLFSAFFAYVAMSLGWSALVVPLIFAEVAFAWWAYLTEFQDYMARALIIVLFSSVSIFYYGSQASGFSYLIPTLCLFTVLFSLYQLRPILDITYVTQIALFFYHTFVLKTFVIPQDKLELYRLMLQLLSLVMLDVLCLYHVQRTQEMDSEISELEQDIAKTQIVKDNFVANTSHELKTPINTIAGMSEILLQEELSARAHASALDIQMTGIELNAIVSDILDYAALESDTLQFSPRNYNISSTMNDVMNMSVFQNREKQLAIIFDCDPRIPCLLYGDEHQLRRVMNNLIGNAIKFTYKGGVMVRVTSRKENYGINLMVSIKDTGIGISRENIEHIFQDFYQADAKRSRSAEGLGLGLTISSRLISKMGGFLTVRSQPGVGSEFSFSLPQQVIDDRVSAVLTHPEQLAAMWYINAEAANSLMRDARSLTIRHISEGLELPVHQASSLSELKRRIQQASYTHLFIGLFEYNEDPLYFNELSSRMFVILTLNRDQEVPQDARVHVLYRPFNALTLAELFNGGDILVNPKKYSEIRSFEAPSAKILVVDDNIMNLKVIEGLLRRYRIKIAAATSGEEALRQIESQDYDLVFMDHMMPVMDGIECFHKIRAKAGEYYRQLPVVALTANAIAGSREMFLSEGFTEFIAKPIDNADLHQILDEYIPQAKKSYQVRSATVKGLTNPASANPFDMEGIDMTLALSFCGDDINNFVDFARAFCESAPQMLTDIERFCDTQDWENYSIIVHALKSTAKTLGAIKLSDLAWQAEEAGRDGNINAIMRNHHDVLREYRRVVGLFEANPEIFGQSFTGALPSELMEPNESLEPIERDEFDEIIAHLQQLLATFESDVVQEFIVEQSAKTFKGAALSRLLAPVSRAIDNFDFEEARSELSRVAGGIR